MLVRISASRRTRGSVGLLSGESGSSVVKCTVGLCRTAAAIIGAEGSCRNLDRSSFRSDVALLSLIVCNFCDSGGESEPHVDAKMLSRSDRGGEAPPVVQRVSKAADAVLNLPDGDRRAFVSTALSRVRRGG